ncbi:MAG: hypothetical protein AAB402_03505 [Patescibacteria group bacterium]
MLGLLGSVALVSAGPITNPGGIPFAKLSVYQGVIAIVPGLAGDSVMEIGNAGRDIAGSSDLVLRPGTSNSLFVRADSNGGSNRATQLVIQGYTNQNLKLNLGIHSEASPAYAEIGAVEESVAWRNLILAKNGGNIGIGGVTAPAGKLVVNNNLAGTGSSGDAIAAYANGDNSAVYGQQAGAGWAGYFSGKVNVTDSIVLGNRSKGIWQVQVCKANSDECLGQYLYSVDVSGAGTNDQKLATAKYCFDKASSPAPFVDCVLVYTASTATYCPNGYDPISRCTSGAVNDCTSYYTDGCNGDFEYVLGGTSPYGSGTVCKANTQNNITLNSRKNSSSAPGCAVVDITQSMYRIRPQITATGYAPAYELR